MAFGEWTKEEEREGDQKDPSLLQPQPHPPRSTTRIALDPDLGLPSLHHFCTELLVALETALCLARSAAILE